MTTPLRPFWRYYGGKWANARRYEPPRFGVIVEPFAGAAGYSLHHHDQGVVLVEKNPVVAAVWSWLIAASPSDVLDIPDLPDSGEVADLDAPKPARDLVGFWCHEGSTHPGRRASTWGGRGVNPDRASGWNRRARERIASQVTKIKHWTIIEGDYTTAPDVTATWFIDPPYNSRAGKKYPFQPDDFAALGAWCRARSGQVMVCEQAGADWLPFRALAAFKSASGHGDGKPMWSEEVIWTAGESKLSLPWSS